MIIFYNKTTGEIAGTIEGRLHDKSHLKMWIGDENITDRIICNWIKVKDDFEPDHEQKEIFIKLDNGKIRVNDFKIDIKTKRLISI